MHIFCKFVSVCPFLTRISVQGRRSHNLRSKTRNSYSEIEYFFVALIHMLIPKFFLIKPPNYDAIQMAETVR